MITTAIYLGLGEGIAIDDDNDDDNDTYRYNGVRIWVNCKLQHVIARWSLGCLMFDPERRQL